MTGILVAQKVQILGASAVAVTCPADTNEDILATVNIPAGAMGLNGILRLYWVWTCTNNANAKTVRARLGGIGGTQHLGITLTSLPGTVDYRQIANRGVANSQISNGSAQVNFGTTNGTTTGAIDTSVAQTFVLTAQKALAGDTITLEQYSVELILP